jgi:hypothetical protein
MNDEQPGHRLASRNAVNSEAGHRIHIMSQHDALFSCGPSKNLWFIGFLESYALSTSEIQPSPAPRGTAHQVVVKVLIGEQPKHRLLVGVLGSPAS